MSGIPGFNFTVFTAKVNLFTSGARGEPYINRSSTFITVLVQWLPTKQYKSYISGC